MEELGNDGESAEARIQSEAGVAFGCHRINSSGTIFRFTEKRSFPIVSLYHGILKFVLRRSHICTTDLYIARATGVLIDSGVQMKT